MSILNSYDGCISRSTNIVSLEHEIAKALIRGEFPCDQDYSSIRYVTDAHADVDSFIHPYWRQADDCVYIDTRGYSTITSAGGHMIRSGEEYDMWSYRAKLELAWVRGDRTELFTKLQFANEVFVRWLTSSIRDKYKLSPIHETKLLVCVALFNIGRFFNKIEGFRMVEKYVQQIVTTYRIDVDIAHEVADLCGGEFPRNVDEFINLLKTANISPALHDISRLALFNMLGGSFFMVSNATAIVALGIEYPPAFAAMVLMAFKHTTIMNKTLIGQRTRMMDTAKRGDHFIRSVQFTIDTYAEDREPGRKLGTENFKLGNEGVGTVVAAVAGGCIFITFLAWVLEQVFGSEKSPGKRAEKSEKALTEALNAFKSNEDAVRTAMEAIVNDSWPDDDRLGKLGDENRKIWDVLSSGKKLPGVKLAVYNFAKSGGKSNDINMGPVKYTPENSGKFRDGLNKATQWMDSKFGGSNDKPMAQALAYGLLSNKPFPVSEVTNVNDMNGIAESFSLAVNIMERIAAAGDMAALSAIDGDITSFNQKIGELNAKDNPSATPQDIANSQGTAGLVNNSAKKTKPTIQLFVPDSGEFNESRLKELDSVVGEMIQIFSDPARASDMAKKNVEVAKKLQALAEENKSKFDKFKNLSTDLSTKFSDEEKQSDVHKRAMTFVSGKNGLMNFMQDMINDTNNVANSLAALSTAITRLTNDLITSDANKSTDNSSGSTEKPEE